MEGLLDEPIPMMTDGDEQVIAKFPNTVRSTSTNSMEQLLLIVWEEKQSSCYTLQTHLSSCLTHSIFSIFQVH